MKKILLIFILALLTSCATIQKTSSFESFKWDYDTELYKSKEGAWYKDNKFKITRNKITFKIDKSKFIFKIYSEIITKDTDNNKLIIYDGFIDDIEHRIVRYENGSALFIFLDKENDRFQSYIIFQ